MALYELALEQFFGEKPAHLMEKNVSWLLTSSCSKSWQAKMFFNSCSWTSWKIKSHPMLCSTSTGLKRSYFCWSIWKFWSHSQSGRAEEALSKLFFGLGRIKYKHLWHRYIAEMHDLRAKYPAPWQELQDGNIYVTKSNISFVSLSADHACEQSNQILKMHSGLIGISNNENADNGSSWLPLTCHATQHSSGFRQTQQRSSMIYDTLLPAENIKLWIKSRGQFWIMEIHLQLRVIITMYMFGNRLVNYKIHGQTVDLKE